MVVSGKHGLLEETMSGGGGVTNLRGPFPINWRCEVKGVVDIENP